MALFVCLDAGRGDVELKWKSLWVCGVGGLFEGNWEERGWGLIVWR